MASNYALINMVDDQETIVNIIYADQTFVDGLTGYDYKLDMSLYSPTPDDGDYYDSVNDVFSHPPEDFNGEFSAAMIDLASSLVAALEARSNVTDSETAGTAISNADVSFVPENAATNLWPDIVAYLTDNSD